VETGQAAAAARQRPWFPAASHHRVTTSETRALAIVRAIIQRRGVGKGSRKETHRLGGAACAGRPRGSAERSRLHATSRVQGGFSLQHRLRAPEVSTRALACSVIISMHRELQLARAANQKSNRSIPGPCFVGSDSQQRVFLPGLPTHIGLGGHIGYSTHRADASYQSEIRWEHWGLHKPRSRLFPHAHPLAQLPGQYTPCCPLPSCHLLPVLPSLCCPVQPCDKYPL